MKQEYIRLQVRCPFDFQHIFCCFFGYTLNDIKHEIGYRQETANVGVLCFDLNCLMYTTSTFCHVSIYHVVRHHKYHVLMFYVTNTCQQVSDEGSHRLRIRPKRQKEVPVFKEHDALHAEVISKDKGMNYYFIVYTRCKEL